MKFLFSIKLLLISLVFSAPLLAEQFPQSLNEKKADQDIALIYHKLAKNPKLDMLQRIKIISKYFIGKPYYLGALGEGVEADIDQYPLYRSDAFDCLTYVETVLSIAFSGNLKSFQQCIKAIRYKDGFVSFATRNHFTSLDWNINNEKQHFLKDITPNIRDKKGHTLYITASALINKPAWYAHFTKQDLRISGLHSSDKVKRLSRLHQIGEQFKVEMAKIPYLPLTALFNEKGEANVSVFNQIPDGAIIEIVRPNWNLTGIIGTHLNVSHMGFAFWVDGHLIFRDASILNKMVADKALIEYLRSYLNSPTIKGINIQIVVPTKEGGRICEK